VVVLVFMVVGGLRAALQLVEIDAVGIVSRAFTTCRRSRQTPRPGSPLRHATPVLHVRPQACSLRQRSRVQIMLRDLGAGLSIRRRSRTATDSGQPRFRACPAIWRRHRFPVAPSRAGEGLCMRCLPRLSLRSALDVISGGAVDGAELVAIRITHIGQVHRA